MPHFYIAKLGNARVYLFFLLLLQNIDCGCSLEPPRQGGSNVYPRSMFWAKIRKYQNFSAENFQFLKLKNLCLLHGQVFVMWNISDRQHKETMIVIVMDCHGIRLVREKQPNTMVNMPCNKQFVVINSNQASQ